MTVTIRVRNSLKTEANRKTKARRAENTNRVELNDTLAHGKWRNDLLPSTIVEMRPVSSLTPAKRRLHNASTKQTSKLVKSVQRFGFRGCIFVRGNAIVDGHTRIEALKQPNVDQVPCIDLKDMSEEDAALFMVGYQETAKSAEYNLDDLRTIVSEQVFPADLEFTSSRMNCLTF